jgi:hypothetical protein
MRWWASIALFMAASACGDDGAGETPGTGSGARTCEAQVDREIEFCPLRSEDRDQGIAICRDQRADFEAIGCAEEYDRYLGCSSGAEWDCERGPSGCDEAMNGYFACQSSFASRTGCSVLGANDARCDAAPGTPNAFGCANSTPPWPECVPFPEQGGSTASLYCCPLQG